ncbi:hypothetical protein CASFOL_004748 [Castilleja foliolosa]|uniref:Trichome birefringence-like N-terminal domain-containing protein n=1 Tax=Castilleja foliolosa TaxID=1961234 RepID=A0ABD3EEY7_9LAMI
MDILITMSNIMFVFVYMSMLLSSSSDAAKLKQNGCNLYEGNWVFDESYPLFDSLKCLFIRKEFDCLKYGRSNLDYLKYRWQPNGCDIKRFDGIDFLKRMKGKKVMFVGDSVSDNHWQSLVCLLNGAVGGSNITTQSTRSVSTVTFQRWFDYIKNDGKIVKDMDRMEAFRKGLNTWAKWVNSDLNPNTKLFFQGISPSHYIGRDWNEPGVTNCSNETEPLKGSTYPGGVPLAAQVLKQVLSSNISKAVHLLDITTLSQLRKDGHPSKYNGFRGMDCTHWCLAGVPDTWNQLLYAELLQGI